MSSGTTDGMSAAADEPLGTPFAAWDAADKASTSRQQSGPPPTAAAGAGPQLPAERVSSTTALLDGHGPLSVPSLAPIKAVHPLNAAAAAPDDAVHDCLPGQQAAAGGAAGGDLSRHNSVAPPVSRSQSKKGKKLIPLRKVLRHSYEYHGLNELFMFCITAVAVTLVLYWHWGHFTAIFKASVQQSFQSYGNPDWQSQSMHGVETVNDAVQYSMGWLEFWLQRAESTDLPDSVVRAQDYGEVQYARVLVNLDRNCDSQFSPHLSCYRNDPIYEDMWHGTSPYGPYDLSHTRNTYPDCKRIFRRSCPTNPDLNTPGYSNLLEWAGWVNVFQLYNRVSLSVDDDNYWWAYTVVAPKYYGRPATRDDYIGRLYNITRQTNLNINNCDWLASDCSLQPNPCAADNVPFLNWFNDTSCTQDNSTVDKPQGPGVLWGNRTFVKDPTGGANGSTPQGPGDVDILDLSAYLSKYAYSIVVDVMAANTLGDYRKGDTNNGTYSSNRDRALFSLMFQRSAEAREKVKPTRVMWQISSTVPVRSGFYVYQTDIERIAFEVLLMVCLSVVLFFQVWQFRICRIQFRSWRPFFAHYWNDYEIVSTLLLIVWLLYYAVLWIVLACKYRQWNFENWDMVTTRLQSGEIINPHWELERLTTWANAYSAWLYMGIVVDFLIFVRVARYMRVHVGLKAFYQVFIIAGREFMDFAVFFFFILVLLGSAIFAFFQLTGGNYLFLRFADGLAVMTRLTFGFLDYEDFQAQALGVGAAVSAVTFLFWLAVVLLVVYTQNIILAIVAEAYEEAKAKLGAAETSFLMLVIMRIVFFFSYFLLYALYRAKLFFGGKRRHVPPQQSTAHSDPSFPTNGAAGNGPGNGPGGGGRGDAPGPLGGRANRNPNAPAAAFELDVGAHPDQDQAGGSPFAANGHQPALGPRDSKDVELGIQPGAVSLGEAPTSRSSRRLLLYRDLLFLPKESDKGLIAAWKRKYWAHWCIARLSPVKGLMSVYQDFTSYKLKEECTWPQAPELATRIFSAAPNSNPPGAAADAPSLPPLTDVSYVDEETLRRLFTLTSEMYEIVPVWFSPFPKLTPEAIDILVEDISNVYGISEDELANDLKQEGLDASQGSLGSGGGSVDARLGQVVPRRGAGFFAQLNAKRREGGAESKQVTMLLHVQRRLEQIALQTERNLESHRRVAKQQVNTIGQHLRNQEAQQAKVLEVVKNLPVTVQGGALSRHAAGAASMNITSPRAANLRPMKTGLSLRNRANYLFHKSGGSAASHAGADAFHVGSPPAVDTTLDAVVDEEDDSVHPSVHPCASASTLSVDRSASAFSAGSGASRSTSDGAQFGGVVATMQQQIEQQQQTLNAMEAMQQQMMSVLTTLLQQQGQHG